MAIKWNVSKKDAQIVNKIVTRAADYAKEAGIILDRLSLEMDLIAAHLNGMPLDLQRLLDADRFNFTHDVFGIRRHLNRETGKLENCFVPRFSRKDKKVHAEI